jgi:hypothetical protein
MVRFVIYRFEYRGSSPFAMNRPLNIVLSNRVGKNPGFLKPNPVGFLGFYCFFFYYYYFRRSKSIFLPVFVLFNYRYLQADEFKIR